MKNKYFSPIPRSNEVLSYLNMHYPTFNTISNKSSKNIFKKENNRKNCIQKLIFERSNRHGLNLNNKKNIIFDEDDTKNSENFKLFMDNLLNKDNSGTMTNNKNSINNDDNSIIHSSNNFFLNKLNYNINYKCSKKEEELYYSFRDNNYLNKAQKISCSKIKKDLSPYKNNEQNYKLSFPKKRLREILCDIDTNKNKDIKKDNNLNMDIESCLKNANLNSLDNILNQYQTKTKNIGIDCKISDDGFFKKAKERNNTFNSNHKNNKNYKYDRNDRNNNNQKLTQTFSLREFDGRMIQELNKVGDNVKIPKKNISKKYLKNKNMPDFKMPKIILYSRNNNLNKENMHQLMTMKENAILFLKDKTEKQNSNTLKNKNINLNNMYFSKETFVPLTKLKKFKKEKVLIPFFKSFEKYYIKKSKKQMNNVDNKKNLFTKFKNKYYYNNKDKDEDNENDLDNVIIKNYK